MKNEVSKQAASPARSAWDAAYCYIYRTKCGLFCVCLHICNGRLIGNHVAYRMATIPITLSGLWIHFAVKKLYNSHNSENVARINKGRRKQIESGAKFRREKNCPAPTFLLGPQARSQPISLGVLIEATIPPKALRTRRRRRWAGEEWKGRIPLPSRLGSVRSIVSSQTPPAGFDRLGQQKNDFTAF